LAKCYKPDPAVYRMAADLLGLGPHQVMMVAAHVGDLKAAAGVGLRTTFVHRPLENGPGRERSEPIETSEFDFSVNNFSDLARRLGA